jgi:hypothetical protein
VTDSGDSRIEELEAEVQALRTENDRLRSLLGLAFDRNFLSITPTHEVRINQKLLDEVDGPMLRHGLQEMHGTTITVPRSRAAKPDPDRLEQRYASFLRAS